MEPFTLATSFATVVSLTADFVSSRRVDETQTIDAYVDWLRRNEHKELAEMIGSNIELSHSLQTLLAEKHDAVMSKLADLDKVMTSVARHLSDFSGIAAAVRQDSFLTEQAISILRQLNEANASRFIESKPLSGIEFIITDGTKGKLRIPERRFVEDDLESLCSLNLLMPQFNKQGDRLFVITREGARVGG